MERTFASSIMLSRWHPTCTSACKHNGVKKQVLVLSKTCTAKSVQALFASKIEESRQRQQSNGNKMATMLDKFEHQ
jgi:hypothetical protein